MTFRPSRPTLPDPREVPAGSETVAPRSATPKRSTDGGVEVRLPILGAGRPDPPPPLEVADQPPPPRRPLPPRTPQTRFADAPVTESGRDLRFDALRGLCALIMIIDHVGGASYLYGLTGGNSFVVSAAEGFIFLSGLMVGLIYGRRIVRDGLETVQWHLLRRAATLYGLTLSLTFLFVGISRFASMPWLQDDARLSPRLLASIATLHRTYYLVDVLVLYTILMVLAPGALLLMHRRRTGLVALLTIGVWAVFQVFPEEASIPWTIINNDTFRFPAWQLWFFGGAIIGYHREAISLALKPVPRWLLLGILAGFAFATILVHVTEGEAIARVLQAPSGKAVMQTLFDKTVARPGKLIAFAIWFPLLYLVLTVGWRGLATGFGWILIPFGQNALYVYAMHLFAVYLGALVLPYVPGFDRMNPMHNTPVQIASVALIWVAVRFRLFFDIVPR